MKKLLLTFLKPYWKEVTGVAILVLIQSFGNLYLPDLNADIINKGVQEGDTGYILRTGAYMLLVASLMGACAIVAVYLGSKAAMSMGRDIRSALFRKVESFSQQEINHFGTPSLITRNTNDVQQIQLTVATALTIMLMAPFMIIGGTLMALRQDAPLTISLAVIIPLMALVLALIGRKALPLFRAVQSKLDRINQVMRDTLSGIRVIRAFSRSEQEEERFDEANLDLTQVFWRVAKIFAIMMPLLMLIFSFSQVAIIYIGGLRIDSGGMPFGNLTAFISYLAQILIAVGMATMMAMMLPRAAACGDRIQQVLDVEPTVNDPTSPHSLPIFDDGKQASVKFNNVEFRYPGAQQPVLSDINFEIPSGTTTAIVGSTGSGKSTLISLLPRFYDVTSGYIEINGVDIRKIERDELWKQIGFVPQKPFLFSGTVASNLRYGAQEADEEEMWKALTIAQGKNFVTEMEGKLEAEISQGGTNVSGGQRQRLAIARALIKRPPIFVFDDSFSALDFKTDSRLRAALRKNIAHATVIIVAQRVSTILRADQIVVLDKGRIVGIGPHKELLQSCETYQEIVYSQLSEEEVA